MPKELFLFTGSYPFDEKKEDSFITPEIEVLSNFFDRLIIIPLSDNGYKKNINDNICVNLEMCNFLKKPNKYFILAAIFNRQFYLELLENPIVLLKKNALKALIASLGKAIFINKWLKSNLKINENTICYTYWFDYVTYALSQYVKNFCDSKLVTRVHGIDYLHNRHECEYIPLRTKTLQYLNYVICPSVASLKYLTVRYPTFKDKFFLSRLGSPLARNSNMPSSDRVVRIVSCSYLIPGKCVDLIAMCIKEFGFNNKKVLLEWNHIGDGICRNEIEELIQTFPKNIHSFLLGNLTNSQVHDYYSKNKIDLFIFFSKTEGGCPVSISEALSYGIPVLANAIDGVSEMVSNLNGVLVSAKPTISEVCDAISYLVFDKNNNIQKRYGALKIWNEVFNSQKNHLKLVHFFLKMYNS